MSVARSCKVLIVGAGPAGMATALYLLRARPDLAGSVVALEKARHPRFKVCAGGLIPKTMLALKELGLELAVPAVEVLSGRARTEVGEVEFTGGEVLCTIIRRDQFDARLAAAARGAGLTLVESCHAVGVSRHDGRARVMTEQGEFEAEVVVGADGSGSRIRSGIFGPDKQSVGRALMTDVPVDAAAAEEFSGKLYRFDFTCVGAGIRGYSWCFPCLIDGRPHLNVGIYDQCPLKPVRPGGFKRRLQEQLRQAFAELPLGALGTVAGSFKAFPIRWYNAADRFAAANVILAGDAAGVDPLMGEGISYAFEHGKLAAAALARYLDGDSGALQRYDAALRRAAVGRKLAKLCFAARHFYGPRHRLFFRLAMVSRKAQAIGMDWYNGAGRFDELPTRTLMWKWMRAVLFAAPVR